MDTKASRVVVGPRTETRGTSRLAARAAGALLGWAALVAAFGVLVVAVRWVVSLFGGA